MMEIEMKIRGLMMDPVTNMPIVILKDVNGNAILPIWVGIYEANAIALEIEKISTPRPMTHDLLKNVFSALEVEVQRVVVTDLRDNTYFALIVVTRGGQEIAIDSRPSDAIALALRTESPIFVEEAVLAKAANLDPGKRPEDAEARLKQWFENIDPDDFSKYEM